MATSTSPRLSQSNGELLVTTENNGTRLYAFDQAGKIQPEPIAENDELAPDVSSPAIVGRTRVLRLARTTAIASISTNDLQPIWIGEDDAFGDSSPLFVTDDRVLTFGRGGELLLVDATSPDFRIVSRLHPFSDPAARRAEMLSHPALVGTRLYLRGESEAGLPGIRPIRPAEEPTGVDYAI